METKFTVTPDPEVADRFTVWNEWGEAVLVLATHKEVEDLIAEEG